MPDSLDHSDAAFERTAAAALASGTNPPAAHGKAGRKVERAAANPRFQQVKDHILRGIREGRYAAGDSVPSEAALAEQFNVSRMTVNRAMKELADEGYLFRIAGSGTFVADSGGRGEAIAVRDLADELAARGYRHFIYPLIRETVEAPPQMAARFNSAPGSPLYYARVLHFRDDLPVAVEERYVSPELAGDYPEIDLADETSHRYLLRVAPFQESEQVIRAVAPSEEMRRLLDIQPGEPCLLLRRRVFHNDAVLSVADIFYAASRYEIVGRSAAA